MDIIINSPLEKRPRLKRPLIILGISTGIFIAGLFPAYFVTRHFVNGYFDSWGEKLADLEKQGLLSREFGAGWQDVLAGTAMEQQAKRIAAGAAADTAEQGVRIVNGVVLADYPSLSIIDRLREVRAYSNTIGILDRGGVQLAVIRTDHSRARLAEFPPVLVNALIAAEDQSFRSNNLGFEFGSFVRAAGRAALRSLMTFRRQPMRGTSTITQQVAKLFISRVDAAGRRRVSRSLDRKLRELRLAAALRRCYGPDDVLEVYLNHCVTSDYGLVGCKDIAEGLFGSTLPGLSDAQCVYLSRMVKWGRNVRKKITAQCRLDMPRIGRALGWDREKQALVLAQIDSLTFVKPRRVDAVYGPLVDLANEFWLLSLRKSGLPRDRIAAMDLIDPSSLIRKKGNLTLGLAIDAPLQKTLETLVNGRGYCPDTTVTVDVRVSESDTILAVSGRPADTVRLPAVLREPIDFREPGSPVTAGLNPGDTVFVTVRYRRLRDGRWRRSAVTDARRPVVRPGQYFAYCIMDSRTGALLAYYSKDRLGSRLACLLRNRTPNGSSTAKPLFNALNFDLGNFKPYERWSDSVEITADVSWRRTLDYKAGKAVGVLFAKSAVRGRGYPVHNHFSVFEGCQHIFDLLATSNNILGAETVYRLDRSLFEPGGDIAADAFPLVQYCYRIGAFSRIKDSLRLRTVTGVRAYKELARAAGVNIDSLEARNRAFASDSAYSVALGTLELSLYEQLHLFNALYNNDLIARPADHPSLALRMAVLNGDTMALGDTVTRYHPFADPANLRPTWLGMHKRLVSNPADGLAEYDIPLPGAGVSRTDSLQTQSTFSADAFLPDGPPSNFAKSGTTDDFITPFNAPPGSSQRTNYGLWNAVVRVDMKAFSGDTGHDVRDLTVACIGECSRRCTGERDGKTLHKFVTIGLLKKAGIKSPNGFFTRYEEYLRKVTPASENCGKEAAAKPFVIEGKGD